MTAPMRCSLHDELFPCKSCETSPTRIMLDWFAVHARETRRCSDSRIRFGGMSCNLDATHIVVLADMHLCDHCAQCFLATRRRNHDPHWIAHHKPVPIGSDLHRRQEEWNGGPSDGPFPVV